MSKASKIASFDPNGPGAADSGLFGLPFSCEEADIVLVPVPWEVTTSYGGGTAHGPEAILEASRQVDLHHPEFPELWKRGIAMDEVPQALVEQSAALKKEAARVIEVLVEGGSAAQKARAKKALKLVNEECAVMNEWVEARCGHWLDQGKRVGLVGGDHSTPLGFLRAQATRHKHFGILHVDAHLDLRIAYEGFTYSHASILYNTLPLKAVERVVSVGIRDFCAQENDVLHGTKGRVRMHHNADLRREQYAGTTWKKQVDRIIDQLPQKVHVTFDIDGLDPTLCPNTGTPVPGGLQFDEATYLLSRLAAKRQVIGFDLVEVSPGNDSSASAEASADAWDANVGARLLFHLCGVLATGTGK
ncbi:MAG: agmatinase family protein [Flavobacteriales bacterium]|nr:agmatinase family protein [Flavobacteriales bacterium]